MSQATAGSRDKSESRVIPNNASPEAPEGRYSGLNLPLFTDLNRKWEIDAFKPFTYRASIVYMKPGDLYDVEKPYFFNIPVDPSWGPKVKQTNVCYTRKTVAMTDIRGHEESFSLDTHGFQLGTFRTSLAYEEFAGEGRIVNGFYPEVKEFLKKSLGCTEVLPFDFQVRRKDPSLPAGSRGAPGKAQPFAAVHAGKIPADKHHNEDSVHDKRSDQTRNAAFRRLKYFHPEFAKKFAHSRFQIVNVWKPLRGPVLDSPLAVCDYRTVRENDRVSTDIIFPDYLGETYNFWPNAEHRFYFIDQQLAEEAWMVKCFDSETASNAHVAQFSPHVSFPYGRQEDNWPNRESVEVRAFVFY